MESDESIYCSHCFLFLVEAHPAIAAAWVDICCEYLANGQKPIKWGFECEAMKFLETNRFIITQEPEKPKRRLVVKPNGLRIIDGQRFFCIEFDNHTDLG